MSINGSKNRGDWSECYVLFNVLGTKQLIAADENLEGTNNVFPVRKIVRDEGKENHLEFVIEKNDTVSVFRNSKLFNSVPCGEFLRQADLLLEDLKNLKGRQLEIERTEKFLQQIGCTRIAMPSTTVSDIEMEVHDPLLNMNQNVSFSIKSYIGGRPTLLNASPATNFIYEIVGLSRNEVDRINNISTKTKIIDRISEVKRCGGVFKFVGLQNDTFRDNLIMIDSMLPELMGFVLLHSYEQNVVDCDEAVEYAEEQNPLHYPRKNFYVYKFKRFLAAKALGLDPAAVWNGIDDANGGYIVVKEDGSVLTYHLHNRDKFEEYLFTSTFFERASSTRHKYASIYECNNKLYMNLNMQIRFKK